MNNNLFPSPNYLTMMNSSVARVKLNCRCNDNNNIVDKFDVLNGPYFISHRTTNCEFRNATLIHLSLAQTIVINCSQLNI